MRAGMMIGELNGITVVQNANVPSGWLSTLFIIAMVIIMGSMIGKTSDWESFSSPPAAPMAAKSEPYRRKPPRKKISRTITIGPK